MSNIESAMLSKLVDGRELAAAWEMGLSLEVFEDPMSRGVYDFAVRYWLDNQMRAAPTATVLEHEFPGFRVPGPAQESTSWLVEALNRRWAANRVQRLIRDAATLLEDPEAALRLMWSGAYEASQATMPRNIRVDMSMQESVEERRRRYQERQADEGAHLGITLGLADLDQHTGGLLAGELCAVAGFAKTGKSFFLAHTAVQVRRRGFTPLLVTLEQPIEEMADRVDALASGVSYRRLTHGELTMDESRRLRASQDEMASLGPLHVEKPQRGDRTVKNIVNRARQLGADYLLIDQLSFIDGDREYRGDRATMSKHSDIVFDLKDEINRESAGRVACMLAVQFNRASLSQAEGKPGLHNFANTSAIEQTVDLALGLSRTRDLRESNSMRCDIMGARRSDLAAWLLNWELTDRTLIDVQERIEQ